MNATPKLIRALTVVGAVALALVVVAVLALRAGDDNTPASTATAHATTAHTVAPRGTAPHDGSTMSRDGSTMSPVTQAPGVPDRAYLTLREIDAGRWPDSANSPGTKGGERWMNRGRDLPVEDASGNAMTYQEWDVNPKQPGRSRDAERIVTGSDGSAWYTGDHYKTFTRMR
ncbi:ribonuclease domain-containing protein [Nocardia sp. NPDC049190]|uniref:ribonuclease domain-containing protein n=1 Tax=Nocardia sp. NPDC049190 TaxID=3155650 RepID=UPI0033DBADDA